MRKRRKRSVIRTFMRTVIAVAVLFGMWYAARRYFTEGYPADLEFGGQGLHLMEGEAEYPGEFKPADLPEYTGEPYTEVNGNVPFFAPEEVKPDIYESYGELDALGRCTCAAACVGPETLPTEARKDVRDVRPSGYHNAKYSWIENGYLYNRCHLIGFQLTGQNSNERNLITGTRYMNIEGMKPFEDSVAQYIYGSRNHVLYRVTPVFRGQNLVASGVLMEARSVEDPRVQFCVYCYNVQPGVVIDYKTGWSRAE